MSTTTGPNTRAGELAMVRIMDDVVDIVRPAADASLVLNQATGDLVPAAVSSVYAGPAMIRAGSGSPTDRGGQTAAESSQTLYLPLPWLRAHPEQEPHRGDLVRVTSTRRDPALVGRTYEIIDIEAGTIVVARRCTMRFRGQAAEG